MFKPILYRKELYARYINIYTNVAINLAKYFRATPSVFLADGFATSQKHTTQSEANISMMFLWMLASFLQRQGAYFVHSMSHVLMTDSLVFFIFL